MTHLPRAFKALLRSLNEHEVRYLLIGGYAVAYHGYPRATADIDIWVAIDPDNAARVVNALKDVGFDVPELSSDLFLNPDGIARMGVAPMRVEIVMTISGVTFEEAYPESIEAVMDDIPVRIISLSHLRQNKKASGRLKDLDGLKNLPK